MFASNRRQHERRTARFSMGDQDAVQGVLWGLICGCGTSINHGRVVCGICVCGVRGVLAHQPD
jgi:hypothetical protein